MAEWVPRSLPPGDAPAGRRADRTDRPQRRRRFPGFEVAGLIPPVMIAVVGAATVGSLFAAGFVLLMQPMPAQHAAVTSPPKVGAGLAPAVAGTAPNPARAALAPGVPPPRTAAHPPEGPPRPAARLALAQGDARLADGNVAGARFFYEQAVDAGDAEGALRLAQTFDPAFQAAGRWRFARGDPAAAEFWYRRALGLGDADAVPRLDRLEAVAADNRGALATPSDKSRRRAQRRHYRAAQPSRVPFYETPEGVLHPKTDGP